MWVMDIISFAETKVYYLVVFSFSVNIGGNMDGIGKFPHAKWE